MVCAAILNTLPAQWTGKQRTHTSPLAHMHTQPNQRHTLLHKGSLLLCCCFLSDRWWGWRGGGLKNMQRHEKLQLLQHFCVVLAFVNQGLFTPQESQSCRRLKRKMFHLLVRKTRHYKKKSRQLRFSFSTAFSQCACYALRFVYCTFCRWQLQIWLGTQFS